MQQNAGSLALVKDVNMKLANAIGQRIKLLRTERHWSQAELGEKIGADGRTISRYEHGHVVPSAEALIELAQVFDISVDYLLVDNAPRRPLRNNDPQLAEKLQALDQLNGEDRKALMHIMESLLTKDQFMSIAKNRMGHLKGG